MAKSTNIVYRVFSLTEPLREGIRTARQARGQTNQQFIAESVMVHLPALVERLQEIGFGPPDGKVRPARLPFSSEAQTLATLRAASERVGVPASQLLAMCLRMAVIATAQPAASKRRRGRRKAEPGAE